jgi:hypothetical protein
MTPANPLDKAAGRSRMPPVELAARPLERREHSMTIRGPDFEDVKREHKALMANPTQLKAFSEAAMQTGFFVALDQARMKGVVGPALFRHEYRRYYEMIQERVVEAEKETAHIASALKRMQSTANQGRRRMSLDRLSASPEDENFQRDLLAFQGWLASLMETYVSIFMYIEGARGAQRKVGELQASLNAIIQRNAAKGTIQTGNSDMMTSMTEL